MARYALVCCQFLFGAVFAVSLISKIRSRRSYADFVATVPRLAPWAPARLAAPLVIAGEAAVVGLVVLPVTAPAGFAVAGLLLTAFTIAIATTVRRRQAVTCQCFGATSTPVGPAHLVRNGSLLVCAAVGLAASLAGQQAPAVAPGVLAFAALTGAIAAGAVLLTDQIADLFRSTL